MYFGEYYIPKLNYDLSFPDPLQASDEGLLAYGGDLSPSRLLLAYRKGIFPWFSEGDPILWWSPNPRLVLYLDDFKVRRSLKKRIKNGGFEVKFDTNFKDVLIGCANVKRKDQDQTWLTPTMQEAYLTLHQMGYAHSVETYLNGELVGGLYGISIGKAFFGESMFALASDASKIALAKLVEHLKEWEFHFIDAQVETEHLVSLGAKSISREKFIKDLNNSIIHETKNGNWSIIKEVI